MSIVSTLLADVALPLFLPVRQDFADDAVRDIPAAVIAALRASGLAARLPRGGEIALGVGSRGIANLPALVRTTASWFREQGCRPFIVPCMGSHGGATGPGQTKVLADLGVTGESAGCPVHSGMDVVVLGHLENGLPVCMDARACAADGIFVINRVKPHTSFSGPNESGLVKMLTIGLGKQKGADAAHRMGYAHFGANMPAMTRFILRHKSSVLGGLAVVENALDKTCLVEAVPADRLEERDAALLVQARSRMPSLPVSSLDALFIDRMGKNISGAGMDPNITGRHAAPYKTGGPAVARLAVFDLTPESKGNATGMGNADIITRRMADSVNFDYTYANVITSTALSFVRMPMALDDAAAVRCAVKTCGARPEALRAIRIRDTLTLDKMLVTPAVADELRGNAQCRVVGDPAPPAFTAAGALDPGVWEHFDA